MLKLYIDKISSIRAGFGIAAPLDGQKLQQVMTQILLTPTSDYKHLSTQTLKFAKFYSWDQTAAKVIQGYHGAQNRVWREKPLDSAAVAQVRE